MKKFLTLAAVAAVVAVASTSASAQFSFTGTAKVKNAPTIVCTAVSSAGATFSGRPAYNLSTARNLAYRACHPYGGRTCRVTGCVG